MYPQINNSLLEKVSFNYHDVLILYFRRKKNADEYVSTKLVSSKYKATTDIHVQEHKRLVHVSSRK